MKNNDFKVNSAVLKYNKKCLVCKKDFILGEPIVLCPIQEVETGFDSVVCIPIHTKCYLVKKTK